jgi:Rrf2 family protein
MYVSARLDYALKALVVLPHPSAHVRLTAAQVAETLGLPLLYLRAALNDLRGGGLLIHERGQRGGYALARAPEEISISDVAAALRVSAVETHAPAGSGDEIGSRLAAIWERVEEATQQVLQAVTIADIDPGAGSSSTLGPRLNGAHKLVRSGLDSPGDTGTEGAPVATPGPPLSLADA